jgi:hypothetical protein
VLRLALLADLAQTIQRRLLLALALLVLALVPPLLLAPLLLLLGCSC